MREEWKEYKLGDVAKYFTEKINATKLNSLNYISADNMLPDRNGILLSDYLPKSGKVTKYEVNDILISNIRPYFKKIWFAKMNGGCSNDVIVLRPNEELIKPTFLYYVLSKDDFFDFMMAGANGTKMPRGNKKAIPKYKITLPPLPTQHKIAKILSAYDNLIENNLKRIKLLEEMAQITYEEWFVRMKFPGHETAVFDKETGLPEGWKKVKLGDFIKFVKGKKVEELFEQNVDGSAKVLLLDALEDGKFKFTKIGKHVMTKRGDIMMLMDGARSSHVFYAEDGIIGSTMAKIETKKIPSSLLYHFFSNVLDWLQTNNTGAAIPHANKSFINKITFDLPPDTILNNWTARVNIINQLVWNLKDQNQSLKEARDILLPRLMTGMVDVDELSRKSMDESDMSVAAEQELKYGAKLND